MFNGQGRSPLSIPLVQISILSSRGDDSRERSHKRMVWERDENANFNATELMLLCRCRCKLFEEEEEEKNSIVTIDDIISFYCFLNYAFSMHF